MKEAAQQLAREIPTDTEGLWKWPVSWDFVGEDVLKQLRPLTEKKIMEYLGVQEQMLVDVVEDHIRKRGSAEELVGELEGVSLFQIRFNITSIYTIKTLKPRDFVLL